MPMAACCCSGEDDSLEKTRATTHMARHDDDTAITDGRRQHTRIMENLQLYLGDMDAVLGGLVSSAFIRLLAG